MANNTVNRRVKASDYRISTKPVPEERKFRLAVGLVAGILGMLFLAAFAEIFGQQGGDTVFKSALVVLPPILTLIIGYYFSHKKP
jgi:lipopolysaccharide export LptBFGC system permease protein LptF